MERGNNDKAKKLNKLFEQADNARSRIFEQREKAEEFYFADVDDTFTEFSKDQLKKIKQTHNIPISTKITWAIVDQLISFLTATKPQPRLLAPTEELKPFAISYGKAVEAVLSESDYNDILNDALRDALNTGSGFMKVCKSDYYSDSMLNVQVKYQSWKKTIIDPHSEEVDFDDARYIILCDLLPRKKAEDEYDITIPKSTENAEEAIARTSVGLDDKIMHFIDEKVTEDTIGNYVFIREYYFQEVSNVYVADTNESYISKKRPEPISVDNPDIPVIEQEIAQLTQVLEQQMQEMGEAQGMQNEAEQMTSDTDANEADMEMGMQGQDEAKGQQQEISQESQQIQAQLKKLKEAKQKMPKKVTHYTMKTVDDEEVVIENYSRLKRKLFKKVLMINDHIEEEIYLPHLKHFPVVHIAFSHKRSPNKTFGVIHYFRDMVMALNKILQLGINELAHHGNRKVFYFENSLVDDTNIEDQYNKPGAMIPLRSLPQLPNGGLPLVLDAPPPNQTVTYLIERIQYMIEYATGIHAVMQGASNGAPETLGATQSLLSFGTQRVKLFSRKMEKPLERLVSNIVAYCHMYSPKEEAIKYFAENDEEAEVFLAKTYEDLDFKVRVELQKSLPTQRALTASLLANVSGQTQDPVVANMLIEELFKNLDISDGDKFAEKVNVVKNMEQQLAQMQQQMQQLEGENAQLTNNLKNREIAAQTDAEVAKAKANIQQEEAKITTEMQSSAEGGQEENIDF